MGAGWVVRGSLSSHPRVVRQGAARADRFPGARSVGTVSRMDEPTPIAYTALQPGTPVRTREGGELGTVAAVLVDAPVDVFDGINIDTPDGPRFVDADQIGRIFTTYVETTVTADEAGSLPGPR